MERLPLVAFAFQTGAQANGGLASLALILPELAEFDVVVVTQAEGRWAQTFRDAGAEVAIVHMPSPSRVWTWPERARALARRIPAMVRGQRESYERIRASGAKVVHFNDSDSFWFGALGARLAGAKVVVALRGTTGIERWRWRVIGRSADVVVTLSDDMRRRYEAVLRSGPPANAVPTAELRTIPSIVRAPAPTPTRDEARARLGIAPDEIAVGAIGAVVPGKRIADLVTAFGAADAARTERMRLHVVGDFHPERDVYARRCAEARASLPAPERVRFEGFSPDVDLWYRALDVVVIASDHEGLARCMIEALAHGTPVVSTEVCSAREVLVDSDAGRVVPVGDFEGLMREVAALAADPSERARLGANGRALVRARYAPEAVGLAYDALYRGLDAAARRASSSRRTRSA